jgi:hypothetical protein
MGEMRRVILRSRAYYDDYEWSSWRAVWLVAEHTNTWRIWSLWEPLTRLVHKNACGERIEEL